MSDPTQGNGAPEAPQGEVASPKYVTEEQFNRAFSARASALEKKLAQQFTESFGGFSKQLETMIGERTAASQPSATGAEQKPSASPSIEEHPHVKGMGKQLAEMQKRLEQAESEKAAERAKSRDASLRQRLNDELSKHGMDPARTRHASGFLVDADKRVRWSDDDDSIVFRDSDNSDVDLSTGLRSWLSSDDGKMYMPPRGVSGSGDRGGSGAKPRQGQQADPAAEMANVVLNAFKHIGG